MNYNHGECYEGGEQSMRMYQWILPRCGGGALSWENGVWPEL